MNDDFYYDQVATELKSNQLARGLWARAFAEADGNNDRAKAIYIKYRVDQLAHRYNSPKPKTSSVGLTIRKVFCGFWAVMFALATAGAALSAIAAKSSAEVMAYLGGIAFGGWITYTLFKQLC